MNRIVDFFKSSDVKGGVQSVFDDLAEALPNTKILSAFDVAKMSGYGMKVTDYNFFELETSYMLDAYLKLYEMIFEPDFIIRNSIVGTFYRPKSKQVCVLQDNNITGPNTIYKNSMYNIISYLKFRRSYLYLQERTIKNSDVTVAVSRDIARDYERELGVKAKVIHNGIDTNIFRPMDKEKLRKKYNVPSDRPVGVSIQKYHPIKGWHIMTNLINTYPDIYWIIVFVQRFSHKKPVAKNVKLLYELDRKQMPEIYNMADFSLQPSACESFNLCSVEAMSCGIPAITNNTGFAADLGKVGRTNFGYVLDQWNEPIKYSNAIYNVLKSGKKFRPRSVVKDNFDKKDWEKKWLKLIKSL